MRTYQLSERETHPTSTNDADETAAMVQTLVRYISEAASASDADEPSDAPRVILDMEVDGVRCVLIRLQPHPATRAHVILSPREQEIARMVAAGYPNKTIAAVLDISSWTVGTHLRRVFAKLGVGSRAAMVARLLEEGLLRRPAARHAGQSVPGRK